MSIFANSYIFCFRRTAACTICHPVPRTCRRIRRISRITAHEDSHPHSCRQSGFHRFSRSAFRVAPCHFRSDYIGMFCLTPYNLVNFIHATLSLVAANQNRRHLGHLKLSFYYSTFITNNEVKMKIGSRFSEAGKIPAEKGLSF